MARLAKHYYDLDTEFGQEQLSTSSDFYSDGTGSATDAYVRNVAEHKKKRKQLIVTVILGFLAYKFI